MRSARALCDERPGDPPDELPVIDLDDPAADRGWDRTSFGGARFGGVPFEDRYAQLAFGLGTVPRRVHRDDPFWLTPGGLLVIVGAVLLLLLASA